ncbi:MAG: potassium channel family protein [Saprospiraceae bacterium]|nr:potassium channel family protein [Saprospiraceae bacterium]
MRAVQQFLYHHKYEVLLVALLQHLFIGMFFFHLPTYSNALMTFNMSVVGVASLGVFAGRSRYTKGLRNLLFVLILLITISDGIWRSHPPFMIAFSGVYGLFFALIFREVMRFLFRPGYINQDVLLASLCGYFLLIEVSAFVLMMLYLHNPTSFKGVDNGSPGSVFFDLVYFACITLATIGYGDITPNLHYTKLLAAFLGIVGQFYIVVLMGIMISKFSSGNRKDL